MVATVCLFVNKEGRTTDLNTGRTEGFFECLFLPEIFLARVTAIGNLEYKCPPDPIRVRSLVSIICILDRYEPVVF